MKKTSTLLATTILLSSFASQAALVKMGRGMSLSSVDGVKTNADTRHRIELSPGTYEFVVKYGTVDDRKQQRKSFHSKPQTISVEVGDKDLSIGVPANYAKPETAAYFFSIGPEFLIKEKK